VADSCIELEIERGRARNDARGHARVNGPELRDELGRLKDGE